MAQRDRRDRISDPWERARKLCGLSHRDVAMAKQLGLTPKALLRNIPAPSETWKLPVRAWLHEMWRIRFGRKPVRRETPAPKRPEGEAPKRRPRADAPTPKPKKPRPPREEPT